MVAGFNLKKWQLNVSKIIEQKQKKTNKALSGAAAYVWRAAVNSIKKPKRITVGEMTPEQRERYEARVVAARMRGESAPKRPTRKAKPGEVPFSPTGILKETIRFSTDNSKGSAAIGAIPFKTHTAKQLEHGGRATLPTKSGKLVSMKFQGNPFMQPALKKAAPKVSGMFKNIL